MTYTNVCFVIMPFGTKKVGEKDIDFDRIYESVFEPAVAAAELPEGGKLTARRTDKDFFAGDIGQEMFQYLHHSRIALADITGLNANVMYEVGVRHTARASGTAIFRQTDAPIPFDINRIKAFQYEYAPEERAAESRALVTRVLTESLHENRLDSPVQQALRAQQDLPALQPILLDAENAIRSFDRNGAIAHLRRAVDVSQGNPLTLLRLGLLLREVGQSRDALDQFTRATDVAPDYGDAWRERGVTENNLSRKPGWDGANGESALREAIRLNPNDFDALASLGGALRRRQHFEEAATCYRRSAEVSSGHPYPLLMALKLEARASGRLEIVPTVRGQLLQAQRMRNAQARSSPALDSPWCLFDSAEIRLYLGDAAGFLKWTNDGIEACEHRWQGETFRSALQLLVDGGVKPDGLDAGIAALDAAIPTLPD